MYKRPPQIACRNRCLNMRLKLPKNIIQFFIFNSNIFDSLTNYYYKTQQHNTTTREIIMNSFDRPQSDSSNFEEMEIYRNELAAIREIEMIESETDHQFDLQQDGWIFNI